MAEYDPDLRRLALKLVYYGPAQSGKTTNLRRLHEILQPEMKGEMMVLETENDRTLFFDLLPMGFCAPSGLMVKLRLFTVPGQVVHDGTRKAVLSRADAVVFVADSQRAQAANNGEAFQNLAENARHVGLDFEALPLAVQFNKRDLPDILTEDEVRERWQSAPWPLVFASALHGEGVAETLEVLLLALYRKLDGEYGLARGHGLAQADFLRGVLGRVPA